MSTAAVGREQHRTEPRWLNPWLWLLAGLGGAVAALIWARVCNEDQTPFGAIQVPIALMATLAAGIAVWLRFALPHFFGMDQLPPVQRGRLLLVLAIALAGTAVAATAVLAVRWGRPDLPGDIVGTILFWLLSAPWCGYAAWQLWQHANANLPHRRDFETSVFVALGGLTAFMASWALYWGPNDSESWDSLRLFLSVVSAFAFLAAPLTAAPARLRRFAVSVLVVLHFAAVVSVAVGAPPGPWVAMQTQHWIFRPYLEFMYLNNAYRFYSPEPSPASQLWFYIEYRQGTRVEARWVKLPDMDERGHHKYPVSLQYTRRLSLTEYVSRTDPMPAMLISDGSGQMKLAPFAEKRDWHSPQPMNKEKLGVTQPKADLIVPLHPEPGVPNYQKTNAVGRQLLSSYARYLLRQPHPTRPDFLPASVRIYRVQHRILLAQNLAMGADPLDWVFYLPYYQGKFDSQGRLMDPDDPFLYWCLPILRERPNDPQSAVLCYVFRHAGDPDWIRKPPLPK